MQLKCGKKSLDLTRPAIMGILNTTPDSFSDGGSCYQQGRLSLDIAVQRAAQMVCEGAKIIDIGGESTRPGAASVSLGEELDRVIPVIEAISRELDVVISVDTSTPEVIREAAAAGAGLINDVRALTRSGALEQATDTSLPVCLMHMQGEPQSMQADPSYDDVVNDVKHYLIERAQCCEAAGIGKERLILDPGFGFGKTVEHNLALLKNLDVLVNTGFPVLVGLSRKSLIGKLLDRTVEQRLPGSLALMLLAVQQGAAIVRVHDVAAAQDVLKLYEAVQIQSSVSCSIKQ